MNDDLTKDVDQEKYECLYEKDLRQKKDSDVRGSLRLEASTSKPITSAGEEISIYVVIRNPFSIPVNILSTETHIPVDIKDQLAYKRYKRKIKDSRKDFLEEFKQNEIGEIRKAFVKALMRSRFLAADIFYACLTLEVFQIFPIFSFLQIDPDERVAVAVSPDEEESSGSLRYLERPSMQINSGQGTVNAILTNKIDLQVNSHEGTINLSTGNAGDDNILPGNMLPSGLDKDSLGSVEIGGITLYPGDSLVKHFVLKTRRWLFFNPVSHTFQIQVRYRIDERNHIDTIPFSVDIRAPMRSSIVGAVIGSVLGLIVGEGRESVDFFSRGFWLNMSRTVIFALVIIVAFARKSNVQQVVSVEDFWGGLFTGFLVGYSGDTFIQSVLGQGDNANQSQ